MRKLLLILFIVSNFSVFSYEINESVIKPISVSITNKEPDFRGVWKVIHEGQDIIGFQIIWKDSKDQYKTLFMDYDNEITQTIDVNLKENKLIIKSVFLETNWETTEVLEMIDKNKIYVEGINQTGNYYLTLERILTNVKGVE